MIVRFKVKSIVVTKSTKLYVYVLKLRTTAHQPDFHFTFKKHFFLSLVSLSENKEFMGSLHTLNTFELQKTRLFNMAIPRLLMLVLVPRASITPLLFTIGTPHSNPHSVMKLSVVMGYLYYYLSTSQDYCEGKNYAKLP